jgi:uncharacterized protein YciI
MYVVELRFGPEPERLALRPAHRERLAALHAAGTVVMAGPFADESGALLVFDVDSEEALDAVLADDPYYAAPGNTIVRRQEWTPLVTPG